MTSFVRALLFAPALFSAELNAEPAETEIPDVTAEIAELRTDGGVLHLAVHYKNNGTKEANTDRMEADQIVIIDAKSKQKHSPIRDANKQVIGGPIGDGIAGGRLYLKLPPGGEGTVWLYFEPLPAGTKVSVELPQMFPFDDVIVTEGPSALVSAKQSHSTPRGAEATLVSATRADQLLKARLKLAAAAGVAEVRLRSPYFEYKDVYLFDPVAKRRYPLMKDGEGKWQATPITTNIGGGSMIPDWSKPILMSLTLQAPPDDVTRVDLILPDFLPFEGVTIEGLGGAGAGGVAAAGKSVGLEGALKELQAKVEPEEISIDLSADVLFDFDKADLKPAAEATLQNLLTVVNSRPNATVNIEGHTDVRGETAYNQALSLRRAESVSMWLTAHGVAGTRLHATGAGESRPVKSGDTEADHQANRRVEIRIRGK